MQSISLILKLKTSVQRFNYKQKLLFHFHSIYGLGFSRIKFLFIFFGINKNINYLIWNIINNKFFLIRLQRLLDKKLWLLEQVLKNRRNLNFILEKNLKIYKFYRKKFNLPCRGQRTHSNRQTMKNFFKFSKIKQSLLPLPLISKKKAKLKKNKKIKKKIK
jgi:ribosomal protein S13